MKTLRIRFVGSGSMGQMAHLRNYICQLGLHGACDEVGGESPLNRASLDRNRRAADAVKLVVELQQQPVGAQEAAAKRID